MECIGADKYDNYSGEADNAEFGAFMNLLAEALVNPGRRASWLASSAANAQLGFPCWLLAVAVLPDAGASTGSIVSCPAGGPCDLLVHTHFR